MHSIRQSRTSNHALIQTVTYSRHTLSQTGTDSRHTLRPTNAHSRHSQTNIYNHVERTGQTVGQTFTDRKVRTHIRHALMDRQAHTENQQKDSKTATKHESCSTHGQTHTDR